MDSTSKNSMSIFEKITSFDYLNKKHVELPKISISTQETGREVNMIDSKNCKTPTKKLGLTTPKKASASSKACALSEKRLAPSFKKKMNFNLRVTPQTSKNEPDFFSGKYNKKMEANDNCVSNLSCSYEIKDQNNENFLKLNDQNDSNRINNDLADCNSRKNGPNIAVSLNLALNMDSKKKNEASFTNSDKSAINMDTPSAIKVAVRMRPLSEKEKSDQGKDAVHILMKDNNVLIPHKKDCFEFDYCLNSSNTELFNYASQEIVYRKLGEPLMNYAFQGYNVCLFAYGQSGSGKTYTMLGTNDVPGVIPRFIKDLFRRINVAKDIEFIVNISFLEIYNEKIYDLLCDDFSMFNKKLKIRENPQTGTYVEDLTFYTVENYENAIELMRNGLTRRSTASTHNNEQSSRSHSIFNMILVQNKKFDNTEDSKSDSETSCISKINLVDLAGSERSNSSSDDRFRESTMINRSLLTLGKVINQLAENNGNLKSCHIPYRDSVLTYLLKDSLGGNSRTTMIATISPAKIHLDETVSTLRYASIAQKIINIVHVNEDPKTQIINSLLKQISFLKKEVDKSKESFEESDVSDSTDKKCGLCGDQIANNFNKLKEEFTKLVGDQKKILSVLSELKSTEPKRKANEKELPTINSNLVDQFKSILNDIEKTDVLRDTADYDSLLDELIEKDDITKEKYAPKISNKGKNSKKVNKDNDKEEEKEDETNWETSNKKKNKKNEKQCKTKQSSNNDDEEEEESDSKASNKDKDLKKENDNKDDKEDDKTNWETSNKNKKQCKNKESSNSEEEESDSKASNKDKDSKKENDDNDKEEEKEDETNWETSNKKKNKKNEKQCKTKQSSNNDEEESCLKTSKDVKDSKKENDDKDEVESVWKTSNRGKDSKVENDEKDHKEEEDNWATSNKKKNKKYQKQCKDMESSKEEDDEISQNKSKKDDYEDNSKNNKSKEDIENDSTNDFQDARDELDDDDVEEKSKNDKSNDFLVDNKKKNKKNKNESNQGKKGKKGRKSK